MTSSGRGLEPLEKLCEKHGARSAFRLRAEYVPGPAAFPDSPEEAEWLAKRETLVITVLETGTAGLVLMSWNAGGTETAERAELSAADLPSWTAELEARGGWSLKAFARLRSGEGLVEFEHEAFEEAVDADPDSLDLDAWKPPRHARTARAGAGGDEESTRRLVAHYGRLLPGSLGAASALRRELGR